MDWIDGERGRVDGPNDHVWAGTDVRKILREGEAHSIWAMWGAGEVPFLCWYVNLQAPLRRVRAEGERVIERLARRAEPFNEPWPEWRADPSWPIPELPGDWAHVPPAGIMR